MRTRTAVLALAVLIFAAALPAADVPPDGAAERVEACRAAVAKLGAGLKAELKAALQEGGPEKALQVCNVQAVPIAEAVSAEEGILVGRTSLKPRNPDNAPDAWEAKVMRSFAAQKKRGVATKNLEAWTVIEDDEGQSTFRYMKAIPTASMCLQCHGKALPSGVVDRLSELYPEDEAVGFAAGELRGAFTVLMPLH